MWSMYSKYVCRARRELGTVCFLIWIGIMYVCMYVCMGERWGRRGEGVEKRGFPLMGSNSVNR